MYPLIAHLSRAHLSRAHLSRQPCSLFVSIRDETLPQQQEQQKPELQDQPKQHLLQHACQPKAAGGINLFRTLVFSFSLSLLVCLFTASLFAAQESPDSDLGNKNQLGLTLRYQTPVKPERQQYHQLVRQESWNANETALILCDVWDAHHCKNAVDRVQELAPRLNEVTHAARNRGMTIIHAPSSCMDFYKDHPARLRAIDTARASSYPEAITEWCYQIPAEERGVYPIDQSDGGEDDSPEEHQAWAEQLTKRGRNPQAPWIRQIDTIDISAENDFITDKGDEVWNILQDRGIKNVILAGVHTNMCVLGRPFGLRRMVSSGMNTVLLRDLTDTMYNPKSWPYVSHFTGTDLIVSHIERHVCPTISSEQLVDGKPFRFSKDRRPHIVFMIGEAEYQTDKTLPAFAISELGTEFRVSYVFASEEERNLFPGLASLRPEEIDLLFISVRRRLLPPNQMTWLKNYIQAGKPVIGIRTASHAFSIRNGEVPESLQDWPEFDAEVFGGNYHNHHRNELISKVTFVESETSHPILEGINTETFTQGGSLYKTSR